MKISKFIINNDLLTEDSKQHPVQVRFFALETNGLVEFVGGDAGWV